MRSSSKKQAPFNLRSKKNLRLSLKNAIKKREKQSKRNIEVNPLSFENLSVNENPEVARSEKNIMETRSASKNISFGRKNNQSVIVPRNLSNTFSLNESKSKNAVGLSNKSQMIGQQVIPGAYNFPRYYATHQMIPHIEISELIRACIKQFDFFLQLSIQNSMLSQNQETKQRSVNLLSTFYTLKEQTVAFLDLQKYEVNIEFTKVKYKIKLDFQ